ncbi:hypothetical protein LCGC14_2747540, partial [marine sediment metagenome]
RLSGMECVAERLRTGSAPAKKRERSERFAGAERAACCEARATPTSGIWRRRTEGARQSEGAARPLPATGVNVFSRHMERRALTLRSLWMLMNIMMLVYIGWWWGRGGL